MSNELSQHQRSIMHAVLLGLEIEGSNEDDSYIDISENSSIVGGKLENKE